MSFLETIFYGNSLQAWLLAAVVLVGTLGFLAALERFLGWRIRRARASAERPPEKTDAERADGPAEEEPSPAARLGVNDLLAHLLARTKPLFLLVVAVYAASLFLVLPERTHAVLTHAAVIALLLQGGIWASATITFSMRRYRQRALDDDAASVTTMSALSFVGRLLLWTIILLLVLDNIGVQVTALLAGLGIGGLAVALAVQNILGDLFASLSIVLDKPFVIGDFLNVDGFLGSVEHIGLKTTRLRSLSGEQLVFSNSDLLNSRVRNFGRMFERRVVFEIGVTYQTPREKLARIPRMIQEIVESQDVTRFDRSHFKEYGDFSLKIETVYFVLKPDYNTYMDVQQAINLEIHRRFEEEGIEFAYPTQTVFWRAADVATQALGSPVGGTG